MSPNNSGASNNSSNQEQDDGLDVEEPELTQRQLMKKIKKRGKKKELGFSIISYSDAAAWLQRSYKMDTLWASAISRGIGWEIGNFAPFTREIYQERFSEQIKDFKALMEYVPSLRSNDIEVLRRDPNSIEELGASMVTCANQTRSNDISNLKNPFLRYLALELPDNAVIPKKSDKSDRGFKNIYTARLIVPVEVLRQLNQNPELIMAELQNDTPQFIEENGKHRKITVDEGNFPAFLWPVDGFDPQDLQTNMFKSFLLVRVYRHLFTTPQSALIGPDEAIDNFRGIARRERMEAVTPASIAWAAIMLRHAATSVKDWRKSDRSFKYGKFFSLIVRLLDRSQPNADVDWIDATLKWWNIKIFGKESPDYGHGDSDTEESAKRAADSTFEAIQRARAEKRRRIEHEILIPPDTSSSLGTTSPLQHLDPALHSPYQPSQPPSLDRDISASVARQPGVVLSSTSTQPTPSAPTDPFQTVFGLNTSLPNQPSTHLSRSNMRAPQTPAPSNTRPAPIRGHQQPQIPGTRNVHDENLDPQLRVQTPSSRMYMPSQSPVPSTYESMYMQKQGVPHMTAAVPDRAYNPTGPMQGNQHEHHERPYSQLLPPNQQQFYSAQGSGGPGGQYPPSSYQLSTYDKLVLLNRAVTEASHVSLLSNQVYTKVIMDHSILQARYDMLWECYRTLVKELHIQDSDSKNIILFDPAIQICEVVPDSQPASPFANDAFLGFTKMQTTVPPNLLLPSPLLLSTSEPTTAAIPCEGDNESTPEDNTDSEEWLTFTSAYERMRREKQGILRTVSKLDLRLEAFVDEMDRKYPYGGGVNVAGPDVD